MKKTVLMLFCGAVLPLFANGKVFLDENANGKFDDGEKGMAGVYLSNGKEITQSSADGSFSFKSKGYWVSVCTPDKYVPTTAVWSSADSQSPAFGFAADKDYSAGVSFIHGSDIQYAVARKPGILRNAINKMSAAAIKHKCSMVICVGDLTPNGENPDLEAVKREFAKSPLQFYPVFGGHDGAKDRTLANYKRVFGPLWYSWNCRGVHFAAFVSEGFLTKEQHAEQYKWLKEDVSKVDKNTPIVLVTHAPGQASRFIREALGKREPSLVLEGHFHNWNTHKTGNTDILCSAPWREGDNGVQTSRLRVVRRQNGKWQSFMELIHPMTPQLPPLAKVEIKTSEEWSSINGTADGGRVIGRTLNKIAPVWSVDLGTYQDYYGSPVISDGRVYAVVSDQSIGAANAGVICLDAENGKLLWKTPVKDDIVSTPVVNGNFVYAASCSGEVFAMQKSDGKIVWRTPARKDYGNNNSQTLGKYGWRITTAPVAVGDGRIYCQSNYSIRALDMNSGKELWQIIRDAGYSPAPGVLYYQGKLYTAIPKQLLVLDPAGGKNIAVLDKKKLKKIPSASDRGVAVATVYGGNIYFPGQILRKFSSDGKELWAAKLNGARYAATPVVEACGVAVAGYNNVMSGFDAESGKLLWSNQLKTPSGEAMKNTSAPVVFKDKVVYACDNGTISIADIKTGKVLQSIQLGAPVKSSPAVSGNLLCVSTFDGRIIGFALQ